MLIDHLFSKDSCPVCGQTPCNCTHLAESAGNIGRAIKSLYQKIHRAGDDEIEYFYHASPIFAQYWDEYEGDLDSIIAEVGPSELQVMLDELESYVDDANLAEGLDRLYPFERTVIDYMQDNSWLSAERAYFRAIGLQKKKQTSRSAWEEEIQHFIDLYNKHKGQPGVAETKVSKYKDLGATKDTTHFIKNVTTGEIVSPHRSKQDAEDALVAHYRGPRDGNEYKIVRARKEGVAEGSHEDEVAKAAAYNERMSGKNPPLDLGLREVGNWAKVGAYGDPIKSAWLNIAKYGVRNNRFNNSVDKVMTAIGNFPDLDDDVYDMYDINQNEVDILYDAYETVYDQWEELRGPQGVAEGEVYDLEKEYGYEKPRSQPRRVSEPPIRPSHHPEDTDFMDPIERRLRADQERVRAGWAAHNAKKGVEEGEQQKGADYRDPPEADYGPEYQDMVSRVKKLAGLGPLKTVYDPNKRVYKNVPTAVQPKTQPKK